MALIKLGATKSFPWGVDRGTMALMGSYGKWTDPSFRYAGWSGVDWPEVESFHRQLDLLGLQILIQNREWERIEQKFHRSGIPKGWIFV